MKKVVLVFSLLLSLTTFAQTKVAHVNTQKLLDTLPSRKEAMKQLSAFEQRGAAELKEMEEEVQKIYSKYMAEQTTMNQITKQYEEERIQKKSQAIQQREQELQQLMQKMGNELNEPILKRVQKAVERVAAAKKINYVIDETTTLYFKGGQDITNEVMVELLRLDAMETSKE
jgi:outer membrane protein